MTAPILIAAAAALSACAALHAQAVEVCNPSKFAGAYGFQISGQTSISGDIRPVASIGRLEFDGQGGVSGVSSVGFAGYYLRNPVTGKYEVSADCTVTWSLQDTSGAWQHFTGKLTPDLLGARFEQTDEGASHSGVLQKTSSNCSLKALAPTYSFKMTGNAIAMMPGDVPHRVEAHGTVQPGQGGNLLVNAAGGQGTGTISIDSDCIATISLNFPSGITADLRGVLVEGGKRIIAIQTDPGTTVTADFLAQPPRSTQKP